MKKSILSLIMVIATILALSVPVFAQSPTITSGGITLSNNDISQIERNLNSENVPVDKQLLLIQKLKNGQLVNSMDPKYLSLIPRGALDVSENQLVKKFVFPDGSYLKSSMTILNKINIIPANRAQLIVALGDTQKVDALLATRSISSTAMVSPMSLPPQYFYGVYMQRDSLNVAAGFTSDFAERDSQSSYIMSSYNSSIAVVGGTFTKNPIYYPNQYQSGSTPAQSQLDFTVTWYSGSGMFDYHLTFNVQDYSYWGNLF